MGHGPALRPPTAWAPVVFLARLLSRVHLTLFPFLLWVALYAGGPYVGIAVLLALSDR